MSTFGNNYSRCLCTHIALGFSMWHGIYGHDDVVERFRRTIARGRLASTYLFVGSPGRWSR